MADYLAGYVLEAADHKLPKYKFCLSQKLLDIDQGRPQDFSQAGARFIYEQHFFRIMNKPR